VQRLAEMTPPTKQNKPIMWHDLLDRRNKSGPVLFLERCLSLIGNTPPWLLA